MCMVGYGKFLIWRQGLFPSAHKGVLNIFFLVSFFPIISSLDNIKVLVQLRVERRMSWGNFLQGFVCFGLVFWVCLFVFCFPVCLWFCVWWVFFEILGRDCVINPVDTTGPAACLLILKVNILLGFYHIFLKSSFSDIYRGQKFIIPRKTD